MESVLKDLELDVREIKYLMEILLREPDLMLRQVTMRRINDMHLHLNRLQQQVEGMKIENAIKAENEKPVEQLNAHHPADIITEIAETTVVIMPVPEEILPAAKTETLEPSSDLRDLLTLNDRFLFSWELFEGDMKKMDNVLAQISQMESPENVVSYLSSIMEFDEENEIFHDFMELIRKYFA